MTAVQGVGSAPRAAPLRLSLMMFLQYAVWGAWLPVASLYLKRPVGDGGLGFADDDLGLIVGVAGSAGALLAPFLVGQVADRWFRTDRVLAVLLAVGGGIQWWIAGRTQVSEWLVAGAVYSLLYMPTLALSNSLAFSHLPDRERQFPRVRLWGTIGWIAAGWAFSFVWLKDGLEPTWKPPFLVGPDRADATARLADAFRFSALLSFAYAAYALTLPATPPRKGDVEPFAVGKALRLLRVPSFLLLVLASLPVAMIHTMYFIQSGPFFQAQGVPEGDVAPLMTTGQFSEIAVMAVLGFLLKGLGFRFVLALGAFSYFLRYFVWSFDGLPVWALAASQALHGLCYACFFAAAYIHVDRVAPPDVRHSAQTLFGVLILGGGPILAGAWLNAWLTARHTAAGVLDYHGMFRELALVGLVVAFVLAIGFRDRTRNGGRASAA